jgi:hypothetical protein
MCDDLIYHLIYNHMKTKTLAFQADHATLAHDYPTSNSTSRPPQSSTRIRTGHRRARQTHHSGVCNRISQTTAGAASRDGGVAGEVDVDGVGRDEGQLIMGISPSGDKGTPWGFLLVGREPTTAET